jgi:predicted DNA-binding transcriptional regulator AlpA
MAAIGVSVSQIERELRKISDEHKAAMVAIWRQMDAVNSEYNQKRDLLMAKLVQSPAAEPADEVLNAKQAAEFLGMSVSKVRKLTADLAMPYKKIGGSVRYLTSELLLFAKGEWVSEAERAADMYNLQNKCKHGK